MQRNIPGLMKRGGGVFGGGMPPVDNPGMGMPQPAVMPQIDTGAGVIPPMAGGGMMPTFGGAYRPAPTPDVHPGFWARFKNMIGPQAGPAGSPAGVTPPPTGIRGALAAGLQPLAQDMMARPRMPRAY